MSTVPIGEPSRGLQNLRDVGGLPAAGGRRVRPGRLYRSDAPILGDPSPSLRPWPPRTVIDLRSVGEAGEAEHPLGAVGARVINIPLLPELNPARQQKLRESGYVVDLAKIYRYLVRTVAAKLTQVVHVVATEPAPLLLHCAAGKDRTGIATAVTLAGVGVPRPEIIADYMRTEDSLEHLPERLALGWSEAQRDAALEQLTMTKPELLHTSVTAIEAVLDSLEDWPGGPTRWLVEHGLPHDELELLHDRLTIPDDA
jgi:protein-tyrosine phosphatase